MNSSDPENNNRKNQNDYFILLPREIKRYIFSLLDFPSLCSASMTCCNWNEIISSTDSIWKGPYLTLQSVCPEVKKDVKKGYSLRETLRRNYQKSKAKQEWLSGKFSNISSPVNLPEKIMYPMDADTWGDILEAELERKTEKAQIFITLSVKSYNDS
ncbi:F-box only protein 48 [Talpa occidentalis]|uniref:F-box only protein 48 n=1 Tax=Talpa occidentalis TaxID=50954 RepID=UPI001890619A|nr:F-box only protein 48 [Talpa occidentalis]XP_037383425.1 F-box only protein 48 [Talpa occidentalis]XP_054557658.1 F-box only protein 48 [Talpa occidentalis]XP_054557659.1 F-box only protein 48 [Talpa occidentalis]